MGFFFLAWENVRPFIPSLQFLFVCLFLEVEISSHTLIPLFMPGSVHSGSASVGSKPVSDAWIVLCDSAYSLITWDRVTGGGPAGLNELKRTRSSSEERWRSITLQFPGGDHCLPCATTGRSHCQEIPSGKVLWRNLQFIMGGHRLVQHAEYFSVKRLFQCQEVFNGTMLWRTLQLVENAWMEEGGGGGGHWLVCSTSGRCRSSNWRSYWKRHFKKAFRCRISLFPKFQALKINQIAPVR